MEPKFTLQDLFTVIKNREIFEHFLSDNKLVPLGEDARCANCGNHCIVTVKKDNTLHFEKYAYCNSCKWHCSLTKDTVFFNSCLDPEDVMIFVYCFCVLLLVDTSRSLEILHQLTGFAKSVIIDWHILCSEVCKVKVDDSQCRNEVQYPFDSENPNKSLLLSYTLKFPVHSFKERFFLFLKHIADVYPGPFKCCPTTETPFVSCGISTEKDDVPATVHTQVDVPIKIEMELDVHDGLVGDKEYQLLEINKEDVDLEVNFTTEEEKDFQPAKKKSKGETLSQDPEEFKSVFAPEISPAHLLNRESCQVANNESSQASSEKTVEEWKEEALRESNECLTKQNDETEVVYEEKSSSLKSYHYRPHKVFIVEHGTSQQQHKQLLKKRNYWHESSHQATKKLRSAIFILHNHGVPNRRIAEEVGVHESTVCNWISRLEKRGATATRRRSGLPRITTRKLNKAIVKEAESRHGAEASSLASKSKPLESHEAEAN